MILSGENKCIATLRVRISPVFWGWLFQFAGQMRLLSPAHVVESYRQQAQLI
jgi:hypothetical protein